MWYYVATDQQIKKKIAKMTIQKQYGPLRWAFLGGLDVRGMEEKRTEYINFVGKQKKEKRNGWRKNTIKIILRKGVWWLELDPCNVKTAGILL